MSYESGRPVAGFVFYIQMTWYLSEPDPELDSLPWRKRWILYPIIGMAVLFIIGGIIAGFQAIINVLFNILTTLLGYFK